MSTEVKVPSLPECDVCMVFRTDRKPNLAAYDGKTVNGPWAYMCEEHWQSFGPGRLGTGYGQRLILDTEKEN